MSIRPLAISLAILVCMGLVCLGCGSSTSEGGIDESGDLDIGTSGGSAFSSAGTTPAGPEIGGSTWRFVEAHCTEGPLDLSSRGFAQQLRVEADADGLLLIYDHTFASEQCVQTVMQRARPIESGQFRMVEEVRISQPATEQCQGRMEDERPGEVRRSGEFLEVLVQRSTVWCNGLEVRMVYAPATGSMLASDQIARHYVAHYNRRDAQRIAALFAESGSLVDPFLVTPTGGASRHDGRGAVLQWYGQAFTGVDWLVMRLLSVEESGDQVVAEWEYMDPRLDEPFRGVNRFTIAAGEIFEAQVDVPQPPSEEDATEESDEEG